MAACLTAPTPAPVRATLHSPTTGCFSHSPRTKYQTAATFRPVPKSLPGLPELCRIKRLVTRPVSTLPSPRREGTKILGAKGTRILETLLDLHSLGTILVCEPKESLSLVRAQHSHPLFPSPLGPVRVQSLACPCSYVPRIVYRLQLDNSSTFGLVVLPLHHPGISCGHRQADNCYQPSHLADCCQRMKSFHHLYPGRSYFGCPALASYLALAFPAALETLQTKSAPGYEKGRLIRSSNRSPTQYPCMDPTGDCCLTKTFRLWDLHLAVG